MLMINFKKVEDIIREVAETEILPHFRHLEKDDISYKIGDDPVTIADKTAEIALSNHLLDLLPGSKVVGEEAFAVNRDISNHFLTESHVWIIDPIDGTRNFIAGKPIYGVIVALMERNQTIAGWLYDPTSKEFITAEKGSGAYYNNHKLRVLSPEPLEKMRGSLGYSLTNALRKINLPSDSPKPILCEPMMCACHEYARITANEPHFSRPDCSWHFRSILMHCTPWDDAAGILIHQEAGGYTAHWNNEPFRPSDFDRGFLSAPDETSWHAIRDWIRTFHKLPH